MKRCLVGFAGFVYGLLLTWASLVVLSRLDWLRDTHKIAHGCNELGKCAFPWYGWPVLYVCLLGPATLAAVTNIYAWRRWTLRRWTYYALALTVAVVAFYFAITFFGS